MKLEPVATRKTLTAVVVHYGEQSPTVTVAAGAVEYADQVVVVANDLTTRPQGLPNSVEWIVPERNLGFGSGFEFGCRNAPADVYLALNSDIHVTTECVRGCIAAFEDPLVGVAGPTLIGDHGQIQSSVGLISRFMKKPIMRLRHPGGPTEADWVTGGVLFVRSEVAQTVGMDGSYFLLYEDVDLCVRARAANWKVICLPVCAIHHQGAGHSIVGLRATYYQLRNYRWFVQRNYSRAASALALGFGCYSIVRQGVADSVRDHSFARTQLMVRAMIASLKVPPPGQVLDSDPVALNGRVW